MGVEDLIPGGGVSTLCVGVMVPYFFRPGMGYIHAHAELPGGGGGCSCICM